MSVALHGVLLLVQIISKKLRWGQNFCFSRKTILENKQHSKEVRFGNDIDIHKIVQLREVCEELLLEYRKLSSLMAD